MFDMNRELSNWTSPFRASHLYSGDDVAELESHLLDVIESEMRDGSSQEDAFWLALATVGDEPTLRAQFQRGWKDLNPVTRIWRLFTNEAGGFTSRTKKAGYATARVLSLLFGLVASLYLFAGIVFIMKGHKIVDFSRPFLEQGVLFTLLLGGQSVFNWTPFRRWRGKIGDWMRLVFATFTIYAALVHLLYIPNSYSGWSGVFEILATNSIFSLGSALWLAQLFSRREHRIEYDELLFAGE